VLEALPLIALGFFLGMRHATDADHVIAISTIVSKQRGLAGAAWIGAIWGVGHTITVMVVGGAIIFFSIVVPPRIGLAMEFTVAIMLVILGILTLTGMTQWLRDQVSPNLFGAHGHTHAHGDYAHSHTHGHTEADHGHRAEQTPPAWLDSALGSLSLYQLARPLLIGIVHGLAGSAAVALLVLAAIRDPFWAFIYLMLFGVGTIAGMMLITFALAAPFAVTAQKFPRFNVYLRVGSGLLSVGFGLFLMVYIGWVDGLFTAHAQWSPQ
jgi:high-affinity nickel-transport protein